MSYSIVEFLRQTKEPGSVRWPGSQVRLQMLELEQIEQVADGWRIRRHIRLRHSRRRIEKVVATPAADFGQAPIAFDELQNRNVIGVAV